MSKVAIVTDSNSGITQSDAKELGVFVLPMPFMINEVEFLEDINLTQEEFYQRLEGDADICTSQPSLESVTQLWDEVLKDYDEVVHIPMSSGLSGSCQTAMMLAQDYNGRVHVVNNQRISVTQRQSVMDAKELLAQGKTGKEIQDILETTKFESSIYITLDTLKYLKKGGRITPAAAALGTLLKLKPVLQIQGEKLDAFSKARTMKQAKSTMINAIKQDIEQRFGADLSKVRLAVAYTKDKTVAEEFSKEIAEEFPNVPLRIDPLSLSVSCHIGPGAVALAVTKNLSSME